MQYYLLIFNGFYNILFLSSLFMYTWNKNLISFKYLSKKHDATETFIRKSCYILINANNRYTCSIACDMLPYHDFFRPTTDSNILSCAINQVSLFARCKKGYEDKYLIFLVRKQRSYIEFTCFYYSRWKCANQVCDVMLRTWNLARRCTA